MERMMTATSDKAGLKSVPDCGSLELLRRANSRLTQFFDRFAGAPVLGTDEELQSMLEVEYTLKSVAALLDGRLQSDPAVGVRDELARYRVQLLRLRNELFRMEQSAASSRARLSARQKHLHAAQAWCEASRATT
jgi:hypothetical protein